ncbi:MAG: sulfatase [Planctomycetota bacterium]|jgi:arylsulfatase A-like enzyme
MIFRIIASVCFTAGSVLGNSVPDSNGPQLTETPANVILITISSLRADHVSCLGYHRDTTPNLDAFSRDNILFRNAFAVSGWMMPAHGSLFTSLYPSMHGATHIDRSLGDKHLTLAEILNDNGYFCVGFCCGPRLDQKHGFAQGFDIYDDYSVSIMLSSLAFGDEPTSDINKQRTNAFINDAAIGWLQRNTHKPFFMFIHYYDNHWDYLPPSPYDELYDPNYEGPIDGTEIAREPLYSNPPSQEDIEHIVALYDGEVKQTDNDLGEMLKYLKDKGLLEDSIVIILGDHGEQFYEHGHTSHHGVYEELIHIPMAISIPQASPRSRVVDSLVSQMDILPTILEYLSIPIPETCRGKSMKSIIEGEARSSNEFVFVEYTGGAVPDCHALRSARYKYCRIADREAFAYDLDADPHELRKIFVDFPEEVQVLQKRLEELLLK